jgi:hypothetical protein
MIGKNNNSYYLIPKDKVNPNLVRAALLWTGRGKSMSPHEDSASVEKEFGADQARHLLSTLQQLKNEFYLSDAKFAADLNSMREQSISDFKARYPDLDDQITEAFAWCYTFDYK